MKVLAIGNSFSEDATRYLYQIAKADNYSMKIVNLVIGGCSLRQHYVNSLENNRLYQLQFNGMGTDFHVSIKEALLTDEWDIVTIQQVSNESIHYDTFQPYLQYMVEYIKKYVPKAKIYLQQTWAYEDGCHRLCEGLKYESASDMLADIRKAYQMAADDVHADGIIPSGEVMYEMVKRGIRKVHRDSFHAKFGIGRYALGLTWYMKLTGCDIMKNTFTELDEEATDIEMQIAKECIRDVVLEMYK